MNKKNILVLTCVAWTATYQAFDAHIQRGSFLHINNMVEKTKNIFEDQDLIETIDRRRRDANTWIENALKANKSDTLKSAYINIKSSAGSIYGDLNLFHSNLSSIKTENRMLEKFRKDAKNFSKNRDILNKEWKPGSKLATFKNHKTPMLRSAEREAAKQEIAAVLIAYAETFSNIAQKAINDFARIDADLFQKEFKGVPVLSSDMPRNTGNSYLEKVMPINDVDAE